MLPWMSYQPYIVTAGAVDPVPDGLVGWYKMENNANDSSPYGNNGTEINVNYTTGKIGDASVNMAGNSSSYIALANNASLNLTGNISIAFWAYITSNPFPWHGVVGKCTDYGEKYTYGVEFNPSYGERTNRMHMWWSYNNGAGFVGYATDSSHQYTTNTWEHWVVVRSATTGNTYCKIYKNAVDAGATLINGSIGFPADSHEVQAKIGLNYSSGDATGMIGRLDDVRIYARILTPAEVTAIYNLGA